MTVDSWHSKVYCYYSLEYACPLPLAHTSLFNSQYDSRYTLRQKRKICMSACTRSGEENWTQTWLFTDNVVFVVKEWFELIIYVPQIYCFQDYLNILLITYIWNILRFSSYTHIRRMKLAIITKTSRTFSLERTLEWL